MNKPSQHSHSNCLKFLLRFPTGELEPCLWTRDDSIPALISSDSIVEMFLNKEILPLSDEEDPVENMMERGVKVVLLTLPSDMLT